MDILLHGTTSYLLTNLAWVTGEQRISPYLAIAEQIIQLLTMGTRPFTFLSPPPSKPTNRKEFLLLGRKVANLYTAETPQQISSAKFF